MVSRLRDDRARLPRRAVGGGPASGMGAYNMDSHNCQRYVTQGRLRRATRATCRSASTPVPDQLPLDRAEGGRVREPARAGLPVRDAHRLRLHPHGAGVHGPGPVAPPRPRRWRSTATSRCSRSRLREAASALAGRRADPVMAVRLPIVGTFVRETSNDWKFAVGTMANAPQQRRRSRTLPAVVCLIRVSSVALGSPARIKPRAIAKSARTLRPREHPCRKCR